ncbi:hypothetical protein C3B78_03220 [Arthrobacter sp. PGP41]|uniref:hypothetical protein n=1 Tax=unclassified Arthrobacter TaxID=235627 RepID=UPI000CDBB93F|nr:MULTISPECIES: hypothetical protein [unclassified Arthrobacter]AUZ33581.1 hypothetical protein C3B78_03220 [Arthrobacter sp. PGP41]MDT0197152.1 hypothetical protein [Arthrobacter sp. AB6]
MGKSGKFAVISGIVAAGLLVLTGMTLAEPVFIAFLGVLALACLACITEILNRGRRLALLVAGGGASLTIGFSLAFISTWELAFAGESSFVGTPLPTDDPDNYFFGAAAAAVVTLLVLFLGAAWPRGRRLQALSRKGTAGRGTAGRGTGRKGTAATGPASRGASVKGRTTAPGRPAAKGTAQRKPAQQASAQRTRGEGTGGLRAPARVPSSAANRPSSSASPARTTPKTGAKPPPRR